MNLEEFLNARKICPFCKKDLIQTINPVVKIVKLSFWQILKFNFNIDIISRVLVKQTKIYDTLTRIQDNIFHSNVDNTEIEIDLKNIDYSAAYSYCKCRKYDASIRKYLYDDQSEYFVFSGYIIKLTKHTITTETYEKSYPVWIVIVCPGNLLFQYDDPEELRKYVEKLKLLG